MAKTVIEKSDQSTPDVTVFTISGTLGFHEKNNLEKLFNECRKRDIDRVVLDVTGLTSLGGGCAKILCETAAAGDIALAVAGAKPTALKFLNRQDTEKHVLVSETLDAAMTAVMEHQVVAVATTASGTSDALEENQTSASAAEGSVESLIVGDSADEEGFNGEAAVEASRAAAAPEPAEAKTKAPNKTETQAESVDNASVEPQAEPKTAGRPKQSTRPAAPAEPAAKVEPTRAEPDPVTAVEQSDSGPSRRRSDRKSETSYKELQKRVVQYHTVMSLNADFYRIQDRKTLAEMFLLTLIAQVGVESAFFLERRDGAFVPFAAKGIDEKELRGFVIMENSFDLRTWLKTPHAQPLESAPFDDSVKAPMLSLGCQLIVPFIVQDECKGVLALGQPIRGELDETALDFLNLLMRQASMAYENALRHEIDNERMLGLVQTLVSLTEENTLARDNTEMITAYTYALAKKVHYANDHMRDLLFGTVLRDIGMIKVSDLIVRSPRELMPEEWEIIKRHPIDGADMLRKMKFSQHAVNIVESHHERFNGEGYPNGAQGQQIPLGARIVAIVESYGAMLQERPTRPALTQREALHTLKENWGMRYDPELVNHFVDMVEHELESGESISDTKIEFFNM